MGLGIDVLWMGNGQPVKSSRLHGHYIDIRGVVGGSGSLQLPWWCIDSFGGDWASGRRVCVVDGCLDPVHNRCVMTRLLNL